MITFITSITTLLYLIYVISCIVHSLIPELNLLNVDYKKVNLITMLIPFYYWVFKK